MKISSRGIELVKSFEGCLKPLGGGRFKPYYCPAGVLTIGWGHTNDNGRKFSPSDVWTQAECDDELVADMAIFERAVQRRVKVMLTQSQFDALVSFTYNCGEGNLAKSSLLRSVNAKDWEGAARGFAGWNRGGGKVLAGLTRRRAAEAKLFRSGAHPVAPTVSTQRVDAPAEQRVDAPDESPQAEPLPMSTSKIGNTSIIAGAGTAALGVGQAATAIVGPASDIADQVSTITDQSTQVVSVTKQVIALPKPGFWFGVLHFVTSPAFVATVLLGSALAMACIWFWRREHRQAGV